MKMDKMIEKYFGGDKTKYFYPGDVIAAEHYITYRRHREAIVLAVGSNEGEVDLGLFWVPEELEHCIEHVIYSAWRT